MKKIFAGIVLPSLAALAVIGSGFSVYFFGENQDKVSADGSVAVENLVRIGELTTSVSSAKLHLDQTKAVREKILADGSGYVSTTTNGNKDEMSNYDSTAYTGGEAKGLYLTDTATSAADKFEIKYNKNTADQMVDYIDGACKLEIKTTFTFSSGVEKYVGMDTTAGTTGGTWTAGTTGVYTYTWNVQNAANQDYSKTVSYNNGETSAADFKFVYLANRTDSSIAPMNTAEPHTDAEYSAMLTAVKGGKLSIETVATIVAVTTGA